MKRAEPHRFRSFCFYEEGTNECRLWRFVHRSYAGKMAFDGAQPVRIEVVDKEFPLQKLYSMQNPPRCGICECALRRVHFFIQERYCNATMALHTALIVWYGRSAFYAWNERIESGNNLWIYKYLR